MTPDEYATTPQRRALYETARQQHLKWRTPLWFCLAALWVLSPFFIYKAIGPLFTSPDNAHRILVSVLTSQLLMWLLTLSWKTRVSEQPNGQCKLHASLSLQEFGKSLIEVGNIPQTRKALAALLFLSIVIFGLSFVAGEIFNIKGILGLWIFAFMFFGGMMQLGVVFLAMLPGDDTKLKEVEHHQISEDIIRGGQHRRLMVTGSAPTGGADDGPTWADVSLPASVGTVELLPGGAWRVQGMTFNQDNSLTNAEIGEVILTKQPGQGGLLAIQTKGESDALLRFVEEKWQVMAL